MKDHFKNSPKGGSHDVSLLNKELQTQVKQLKRRLAIAEEKQRPAEKQRKKIRWGKVIKFFKEVIIPGISSVSRFLNSIANLKEAYA